MSFAYDKLKSAPDEQKSIKRLLLYAHFDRDGKVDPHVVYQIKSLHDFGISIIFISNSPVSDDDKKILKPFIIDLRQRLDEGYDATAWKETILSLTHEYIFTYDEIIIMNDSCYGPLFPLEEMFTKMDQSKADFWGITENTHSNFPEHLHNYFCVFRKSIFQNKLFFEFWKSIGDIKCFEDAIQKFELKMTSFFIKLGYTYDIYVKINSKNMSLIPTIGIDIPFVYTLAPWFIKNYKLPFAKIKYFQTRYDKTYYGGYEFFSALQESGSIYPREFIFNHIYRTRPLSWFKNMPGSLEALNSEGEVLPDPNLRIAVFAHIFYSSQVKEAISWINNIPYPFDLYISTPTQEHADFITNTVKNIGSRQIQHMEIRLWPDRGRDVAPWLLGFKDVQEKYDLALKFHMKKSPSQHPVLVDMWNHFLMRSVLASSTYISNLINLFCKKKDLGIVFHVSQPDLLLANPNAGLFEGNEGTKRWRLKIFELLNSHIPEETSWSLCVNNIFWYRPKSLATLLHSNIMLSDFPAEPFPNDGSIAHGLERALPYIVQDEGYFYNFVIPIDELIRIFQHYEDRLATFSNTSVYLHSNITNITPNNKYKKIMKYCSKNPHQIPITRAFQIAFMSLYGHLKKDISKYFKHKS